MELLDRCASDLDLSLLIRFRIELGENFVCFFFICDAEMDKEMFEMQNDIGKRRFEFVQRGWFF